MPKPMTEVMQEHKADRDPNEPHVEHGEEPRPARLDAGGRFVNRRRGEDLGDSWMTVAAGIPQVVDVNRGPGVCMGENAMLAVTGCTVGDVDITGLAF